MSKRHQAILSRLREYYPDAKCALNYETPFQLLVATILSAQCTDERVNQVTKVLFQKYPNPESYLTLRIDKLEKLIFSTGFYRSKAKSIWETSKIIVDEHQGEVPRSMEALTVLRGVGRKTANVVLGNAFGLNEGIVVDTHVGRISRRLNFTKHKDPVKVEKDLIKLIPRKDWTIFSHWLILHGRALCKSLRPKCSQCFLSDVCPYFKSINSNKKKETHK